MKLKVWLSYIFFVIITIVVAALLSRTVILTEPVPENVGIRAFYEEQQNNIDAVFVGPSSIFTTILPPVAYHKYGITTAAYAIPNLLTEQYIHCIRDILKYQKPKVIFICVDNMFISHKKSDLTPFILNFIYHIKMSLNKIKIVYEYKKIPKISYIELLEYYFPIIRFHHKWKKIRINSFTDNCNSHKGALTFFIDFHVRKFDFKKYKDEQKKIIDLRRKKESVKREKLIERQYDVYYKDVPLLKFKKSLHDLFISLLSFYDVKFVLIETPFALPFPVEQIDLNKSICYDTVYNIAQKYEIDYIDMNSKKVLQDLKIDENNDFLDFNHLNFWGAMKTTDYLANLLVTKYGLKDKRNDVNYDSWNKEYEFYRNEIKRRYNIDIESGELGNSETNN